MRSYKIGLGIFVCLLAVVSTSSVFNLPIATASRVLAQTADARKAEADRLLQQGIKQFQTSQFTAALQSWQQALSIYREIKNRQSEGKALLNLGLAYLSLGDYPKAIEYQQQVLAIAREIKDRQSEGAALLNLGLAYVYLGDYPKAIEYLQQSLSIAQEIKDREGEGKSLGNLGLAYLSLGKYPKAIEYLQQLLAIAREIKDRQSEGVALSNLGLAYVYLGDYPKAIEYLQQGLAIARSIQDRNSEAKVLGNLGLAYLSLGDYKKAIEYLQQSLAIARQIQDRQSEGGALSNLGLAYVYLGDYPKAIEYLQQSLVIARQIQARQGEAKVLGNLGLAYLSLGDYKKAIEYIQQFLAIARQIQDRQSESESLGNLGLAYGYLGDYKQAIEYIQQWLAIAREIQDRQGEGLSLGNLGVAYGYLGDYKQAIEYLQQWLVIARQIQDRHSESLALNNLGFAFYKQGNLTLAESTLRESLKVKESLRGRDLKDGEKVSIFETQSNTYRTLQQVLIAQNKTDAALEIAESGRGRAFVELLTSRLYADPKQQFLTTPNIAEIKQIAKSQNATLVQYSIVGDEFKIAGKSETKESELYIWVIKPTGKVSFHRSDLKPLWQKSNTNLSQLVEDVRTSIGVVDIRGRAGGIVVAGNGGDKTNQNKRLKQLHEVLIKPIADSLPKNPNDHVIFIPQGSLFLVPFPALQDADNKYLIEKHTILTAPSIQVLSLTRQQKLKNGSAKIGRSEALVVGNPTMPSVALKAGEKPIQLPPLLGAEREAQAIAPLLKTKPIIGSQATEIAIAQKMPSARFIHLATHGLLDDDRGLGSAIALTPAGKDDGLLTAEEILNLKLNADLVVLSACDTGRGRITGDGVIGLSRSLISAGVSSVMVSLWAVDDSSTAFLMTEFYQNLQQGLDKATALRKAMLAAKDKYSNPLQWSAFTLIGEAE
ncbi:MULTISPECIES: CHAT domain-containing tetratricopeptide repeat protein [unclassified Tolypothrix]|uniref:CHAT domain-containing tetratricopeptide repeat protein n=1 Tax=unclassified Tolypothrix TaxID=2649714 RepID=UPI0005EAC6E6|nr:MULTISPECIES: CHAT domain-containing protein [unclassified Tolypothrix]BAY95283.1 TPR repeat-containing protein [Microchaete diplosiphon NIES-3275]EKE98278.1 tetratricopeptide repeat protein [Tolypothrix sp. PCC 7601]MBE9084001.1 tetratricopeptide repeat protein [Tolypothrix sp. LEGE 11397]UYD30505.1 tetratricopeptide repeat protein [Tolypothrix sp. PCC 7712]UYD38361.1 tetratricopeptide repeat protein [Tolypothrix sp. PCC 7601]